MVVFGAGASYDSIPHVRSPNAPYRLPLGDQLFDDRVDFSKWIERFKRCNAVIPYLRNLPQGSSVESQLEGLRKEAETNPTRHKQLSAVQFYLQSMIWECEDNWNREQAKGVSNYKTLLDQIESWRREVNETVCFVTFNYDRMLENALLDVDINIQNIGDYVKSEAYKIIKLHGSVDWGHEVVTELDIAGRRYLDVANDLIERRSFLRVSEDFCIVLGPLGSEDSIDVDDPGPPVFPALAIPVENKQDYECPEEQIKVLQICIPEVTKMVLIGWRATETHFLELLKARLRKKITVKAVNGGQKSEKETVNRLASALDQAGISTAPVPSNVGFSDFVISHQIEGFLRS